MKVRFCLIIGCYCALLRMSYDVNLIQDIQNNVKDNSFSCVKFTVGILWCKHRTTHHPIISSLELFRPQSLYS